MIYADRPCEWLCLADVCAAGTGGTRAESVHRVRGVRLCEFHSPYDVTPENAQLYPLEDDGYLRMREALAPYRD